MGTTRIKVIDLSSSEKEIKTSRKHAEKLAGVAKIKKDEQKAKTQKEPKETNQEAETPQSQKPQEPTETKKQEVKEIKTSDPPKKHLHHQGKKYKAARKLIEDKTYSTREALAILPKTSITRFDPAVEIHLNVIDKNVKAKVAFPHPTGAKQKDLRYLVFASHQSTIGAKHIIWGSEKTIAEIEEGNLKPGKDFDLVIADPEFMPLLARVAKILGPKGIMPNPKNGTVTNDVDNFFAHQKDTTSEFKTDPLSPIIHAKIGKLSQGEDELSENLKALILGIGPTKIRKAVITSTMGPGIKIDISSL